MRAKVILVLYAHAFFIQVAFSQCLGRGAITAPVLVTPGCGSSVAVGYALGGLGLVSPGLGLSVLDACGWAGNSLAAPPIEIIPTSGGGLPVSSVSAIAPSGLSVASENVYEGALSVAGELPFLSVVALEGVLPTAGAGAVSYSCGNGVTAVESIAPAGTCGAGTYAPVGAIGSPAVFSGRGAYGLAGGQLGFGGRVCGCGL